ncbi:MAG: hydroxymethylglutaryl-CoA reductase [Caldilineaceae bacterium]|nr:hydroxymethylglutaryl-CoA reductase [Caldilineaceae bacterium]
MALIPSMLLKRLYTFGSLENVDEGVRFNIKNRLSDAQITEFQEVRFDGKAVPLSAITLDIGHGGTVKPAAISESAPIDFPLRQIVDVIVHMPGLEKGKHEIEIAVKTKPFGRIKFSVDDAISERHKLTSIPRDRNDDYNPEIIGARQRFVSDFSDSPVEHISHYSFDAHMTQGNVENFTGVVQIPLGFAGPLTIHGEHAQGDFIIPLATTEGTLVASYNRGIKLINLSGGVKCTVVADAMQRAPVFIFEDARGARDFVKWVGENMADIREHAESTSSVAKLDNIDPYLSNKFAFLRFNYTTGDAAGQNMVGRATFAACSWILDHYSGIERFFLESNFATDKKASQVNIMRTRGKRVTAEVIVPRNVLIENMRVTPEQLFYHYGVANIGSILAGVNNNGLHSANAITAIFIATGQDVANVSESSAGIIYTELTPENDLYISITIPSLIVATYGGGTGLATQRECLGLLGCVGKGKVHKFAEIVAGTVLAGELSLAAAISSLDWVSSHEQYGRNR